jgi:hypothetical protein
MIALRKKRAVVKNSTNAEVLICEKLMKFGYARERHIRLYGEEFHLVSNAFPDGEGFAVDGISRHSGERRRMRIPLSVVQMLKHELASRDHTHMAA